MGTKSGDTVRLYASQAEPVWQAILRDGVAHSREEYVKLKYGESAPVFLTAYRWYISQAVKYAPKPEGAEFPYWAFHDPYLMESGYSTRVLTLDVPKEEVVLFDMQDWNKLVQLKYMSENPADEKRFLRELSERGITARDIMLTGFYPDLKQAIIDSWQHLFRHHNAALKGDLTGIHSLQAGLWRIRKEWVIAVDGTDFVP